MKFEELEAYFSGENNMTGNGGNAVYSMYICIKQNIVIG
jgi:hypothetical protein